MRDLIAVVVIALVTYLLLQVLATLAVIAVCGVVLFTYVAATTNGPSEPDEEY